MKFIYTTCKDSFEAQALARGALEQKLAVCVDMWEVDSMYPWNGETEQIRQMMVMFTTDGAAGLDLEDYIRTNHSYQVPLIARADVAVSQEYKAWAENQMNRL